MSRLPRVLILVLVMLCGLVACGSMGGKRNPRDVTLYSYVSAIRWNDFDKAVAFIDPAILEEHPIEAIDLERMKQFQVVGYDVRTSREPVEFEFEQVVEIRIVNRHTQAERVITDRQHWRWDAEAKHWWLTTGLPDFSQP